MKHTNVISKEGWLTAYDGQFVMRIDQLTNSKDSFYKAKRYAINLKGCNGSGKSTIPMQMISSEPNSVFLTAAIGDTKPCGIYVPTTDTVILGTYMTACGGCDGLGNTQIVKQLLVQLWKKDVHIIYEGVIVGDIRSTFYELMVGFNTVHERNLSFCFMGTRLSECLKRIQVRNGGKEINEELVRGKYRNSQTQLRYYLEQGDIDCQVLDTKGTKAECYTRFMNIYPNFRNLGLKRT